MFDHETSDFNEKFYILFFLATFGPIITDKCGPDNFELGCFQSKEYFILFLF